MDGAAGQSAELDKDVFKRDYISTRTGAGYATMKREQVETVLNMGDG